MTFGCNSQKTALEDLDADRIEWMEQQLENVKRMAMKLRDDWYGDYGDDFVDGVHDLLAMLDSETKRKRQ